MDRSAANFASTQEQTSDFQFDRVRFPFEPWIGNYLNVKSNVECAISDFATPPKKRSPSNSTKADNPHMVARMLREMKPMMKGCKPTAAICLAMQKKIDAEEVFMRAIDKEVWDQRRGQPAYPKATILYSSILGHGVEQFGAIACSDQRPGEPPHCNTRRIWLS